MKKLLALSLLVCLSSNAQEVIDLTKLMKCSKAEFVMNHFTQKYGEMPQWVGKTNIGTHITLLVNKEKRSWTMLEYDGDTACVLGVGDISSKSEI